ncbi:hypothetical protein LTR17_019186 [Elasticomyces elasticus]|nr:hypothetical protein LTR17_019186 [Elasticomyces elasticus]
MAETYVYDDLPEGSIRLLELLPGTNDDQLACRLVTTPLEDAPRYEAMSYVWGTPEPSGLVQCQGTRITITTNLAHGLRRVRDPDVLRVLWADQICINQADLNERSAQVKMMGKVFSLATCVIIWLGMDDPHNPQAAIAAKFISKLARLSGMPHDTLEVPPISDPYWAALETIYSLPYFRRVWTYQEMVLAPSHAVLWGDKEISYSDLVASIHFSYSYQPFFGTSVIRASTKLAAIWFAGRSDLHKLLQTVSLRQSSDPRGKVYGIIGLLDDEPGQSVPHPDYTLSVRTIFARTALWIVRRHGNLDFLAHAGLITDAKMARDGTNPAEFVNSWPSWVPRWQGDLVPAINANNDHRPDKNVPLIKTQVMSDETETKLYLRGLRVGKVRHIASTTTSEDSLAESFWEPLKCGWEMCSEHSSPHSNWPELLRTYLGAHTQHKEYECVRGLKSKADILTRFAYSAVASCYASLESGNHMHPHDAETFLALPLLAAALQDPQYIALHETPCSDLPSVAAEWRVKRIRAAEGKDFRQKLSNIRTALEAARPGETLSDTVVESIALILMEYTPFNGLDKEADILVMAYDSSKSDRRFFLSDQGLMGLGPNMLVPGNPIAILFGSHAPVILDETDAGCVLLGQCHLEGIMEGQHVQRLQHLGTLEQETKQFVLI